MNIDLDELERLEREATPGPWVDMDAPHTGYDGFFYGDGETILGRTLRIEDCIPEVRNAIPALLAAVRAMLAHREAQLDAHHERTDDYSPQMDAASLRERETWHTLQSALAPFRKEKADD